MRLPRGARSRAYDGAGPRRLRRGRDAAGARESQTGAGPPAGGEEQLAALETRTRSMCRREVSRGRERTAARTASVPGSAVARSTVPYLFTRIPYPSVGALPGGVKGTGDERLRRAAAAGVREDTQPAAGARGAAPRHRGAADPGGPPGDLGRRSAPGE